MAESKHVEAELRQSEFEMVSQLVGMVEDLLAVPERPVELK